MDYKEQLLKALVEKYRKSKKDAGTSRINRKTKVKPTAAYADYYANDGDFSVIMAVNEAIGELRDLGFVSCREEPFSYEIGEIILIDEKTADAEAYLRQQYGYESKQDRIRYAERLIAAYGNASPVAEARCRKLRMELEQNRPRKDYSEEEDLLKALAFLEHNHTPLFLREASMLIYGDSKYLEEHLLSSLCQVLRAFHKRPCRESELLDEILEEYAIRRELPKLCFKGPCTLVMADKSRMCIDFLAGGIELSAEDLGRVEALEVRAEKVITIENKTAYYRFEEENALVFYLGGYVTRSQRDFLLKVKEHGSGLEWFHFGDIDAGGFFIHDHLCRMTGIPFRLYRMGLEELQNPQWKGCLKRLSKGDVRRLQSLSERPEYRDAVSNMLENQVKLEQEIVCYHLMAEKGTAKK